MDFLFNLQIPPSTQFKIVIPPTSKTFINGFSRRYSREIPQNLNSFGISNEKFLFCVDQINIMIGFRYPCQCSILASYMCCLCSLGLCFYIPKGLGLDDLEKIISQIVKQLNNDILKEDGLELRFFRKFSTSWFEISRI